MIAFDFGTFVMFSIFEYVILVFPKHRILGVFEVIHKEITQIGKSRPLKIIGLWEDKE